MILYDKMHDSHKSSGALLVTLFTIGTSRLNVTINERNLMFVKKI